MRDKKRKWVSKLKKMSREEGGGAADAPQAQYVGPYRLEKTLGKGQTGIRFNIKMVGYIQPNGWMDG